MTARDLRKPVRSPTPPPKKNPPPLSQLSPPLNFSILIEKKIFSDAILALLHAPAESVNGILELDEHILRTFGRISDFSGYALIQGATPRRIMPMRFPSLLVDEQLDEGRRVDSNSSKDFVRRFKL